MSNDEVEEFAVTDPENMVLLIATALLGYELENGESFSVDNDIMNDVIYTNNENGTVVPVWACENLSGRTVFSVEWKTPTEVEEMRIEDE